MFGISFLPEGEKAEFSIIQTIFWILTCVYSLQFFTLDVNQDVMQAFIHNPNLIFHEAGHVILGFFGDFIRILGGSLGQCLMPLIVTYTFLFKEENPFGASFGLWWLGQNFTDVALYMSDATARSLPLIGGMGQEAHDWGNLLTMLDMLKYDHTLGIITHYIGMLLMITGLFWGGYIQYYTFLSKNK